MCSRIQSFGSMVEDQDGRCRDAEALLQQVEAAERAAGRGQLKIFLGYASGVGKSFRLFDEGRRQIRKSVV